MITLSIIVPFFNSQRYIEECISSLCEQNLGKDTYEVIAVNDASNDESESIVSKLQQKYSMLKLINLEQNIRQGGARNVGLREAMGKWIWFVDADDYIKPNSIGKLFSCCDDEIDVLHFDYMFDENGIISASPNAQYESGIITGQQLLHYPGQNWCTSCVNVWQRIVRKDFLLHNNLSFAENVQYEDVDYSFRLLTLASRIKHINSTPYIYRRNLTSTIHKKKNSQVLTYLYLCAVRSCDVIEKSDIDPETRTIIRQYIQYILQELNKYICFLEKKERTLFYKTVTPRTAFTIFQSVNVRAKKYPIKFLLNRILQQ